MGNLSEWVSYYVLRLVQRVGLVAATILTSLTFVVLMLSVNDTNIENANQLKSFNPNFVYTLNHALRGVSVSGCIVAGIVVVVSLLALIEPRTRRYDKARTFDAVVVALACIGFILASHMIVHSFLKHALPTSY